MTSWGKLIGQLTGFTPTGDEDFSYNGGCLRHGYSSDRCCAEWMANPAMGETRPAQSFPSPESIHWLTTLTPEALSEIRKRNKEYCKTCEGKGITHDRDEGVHTPAEDCTGGRVGTCPEPAAHHEYRAGGLPPSWDQDAIDRALLLRALDEAMAAAEDC